MSKANGDALTQSQRAKEISAKRRLLVVDDDELVSASIRLTLPSNWSITECGSVQEAELAKDRPFAAALVDMHLTGSLATAEGLNVIAQLHRADPHLEIIAISGDLDRNLMEQALHAGATRFWAKPIGQEELELMLEKIEAHILLRERTHSAPKGELRWIGNSDVSQATARQIAYLKGEGGPILIEGESGTGKEVAAFILHQQESVGSDSGAGSRPMVSVNLGAIPEAVFESEFFGHVKGAFTGADQNKMGLAEAAHGGDLFLDEIEALPIGSQAKLLRFLETGEVRKVGGRETIRVRVRVIAATNRSLHEMASNGQFREDLLWRLQGKRLLLPPLRARLDDIGPLAQHFLEIERPRRNKTLADDAVAVLREHLWLGNVRELKRLCEQLSLCSPLPIIRAEDVRSVLPQNRASAPFGDQQNLDLSLGLVELTARFEADVIKKALSLAPDVDRAAEIIGISRSSMYKKMKDFGIDRN